MSSQNRQLNPVNYSIEKITQFSISKHVHNMKINFLYELTIHLLFYSCCQSDRKLDFIPTNCFESNRCPGMHWLGKEACSNEIMNSIGQKLIGKSAPQQIRDWFHVSIPIIRYILEDSWLFPIHSYSTKPKAQTLILCLVHVICTERRMPNFVLNVCFDFFSWHEKKIWKYVVQITKNDLFWVNATL